MQITRDNYASYAKLIQQMSGGKLNPADEYGTDYGNFSLRFTPTDRPFVKPDRKAIYEDSMKRTGGKMNGACMFWDAKGNKTLSYNPVSGHWKAISTEEEFARAREFTSIYNDEFARLKKEYGAKGSTSLD